ncbi:MAG TPA: hypothetical protein VJ873_06045 [bacterium]|nr:hypothetical protein [bacterium]
MAVDLGNTFHYFFPLLFCLIGFHGVLFYSQPRIKAAAWCAFQLGLVVFLFLLASPENPFPTTLALLILAVTLGTGVPLAAFCVKLGGRAKPARRSSK